MSDELPTPAEAAELADLANAGDIVFRWKGREYDPAAELTLEQRGRYGRWLKNRALEAATGGAAADAPEDVRRDLLRTYLADAAAGKYDYGSIVCLQVIHTPEGMAHTLYLLVSADDPTFTPEDATRVLREHATEWMAAALARAAAPKSSPPGVPGAGPGPACSPTSAPPANAAAAASPSATPSG
jgi:hypothetical protein